MNTIPIHWAFNCRGDWDHGMMMLAEEQRLIPASDSPVFNKLDIPIPGTVVCINGWRVGDVKMREFLSRIRNCLVLSLSDEEGKLHPSMIHPSNVLWTQFGYTPQHDNVARWIPVGIRRETAGVINDIHPDQIGTRIRWSFIGQTQNAVRRECTLSVLRRKDGLLKVTTGFGGLKDDGVKYHEYIRSMLRSDFVLCPTGNISADTFRFAEALECGAIPIVNQRGLKDPDGFNYWTRMFGRPDADLPFFTVADWSSISDILDGFTVAKIESIKDDCRQFWLEYKREFVRSLVETVEKLRA